MPQIEVKYEELHAECVKRGWMVSKVDGRVL